MSSMRSFFYWGQIPLEEEVTDDILAGLTQPQRTLFYSRKYGGGVSDFENAPLTAGTAVMLKYEVAKFFAIRNSLVTDGNSGVDRRAVTSQSLIKIEQEGPGYNISVEFILLGDLTRSKSLQVPIGGFK